MEQGGNKPGLNTLAVHAGTFKDEVTGICAPAATSHVKMTLEERQKAGIKDSLLRLSVGIEDCEDILNDILQAI